MFSVTYFKFLSPDSPAAAVFRFARPGDTVYLPSTMDDFRTELKISPAQLSIGLKSAIVTQGSCFSDAIGERLATYKLRTLVNPFGVIYNPESIHKVLTYSIYNEPAPEHTFLNHNNLFANYDFHSEYSAPKKEALTSRIINTLGSAHYFLKDADWLLITYGTAWVYQRKETGEIVANCHRQPSALFSKSLLNIDSIHKSFRIFFEQLKRFNPGIKIILTVSPVRHIKDTLELNSVSKSVLRLACHQIAAQFDDVDYFPAFEIMMDDLRDYRFYKSDMLHPTDQAEDYIWEKFVERYFSGETKDFVQKWRALLSATRHKPFHPETPAHQQFLIETLKKLDDLKEMVNLDDEIAALRKQLLKNDS